MKRGEKMPYVRFYASDWLAGTRGMKASEVGVYITLIALMYERCEPLPEDTRRLARQCGCTPKSFENILSALVDDGKIIRLSEGLWNKRVQKEFTFRAEKSHKATEAANERWEKHNKNNGRSMQTQSERNASGMPIPEARSHIPDIVVVDAREVSENPNDPEAIHDAACQAIGVSRETHMAYASSLDVRKWLAGGCTAEDIREGIRRCMVRRADPPNSMRYFERAVMDAKADRERPLPEGRASPRREDSPHETMIRGFARALADDS